VTTQLATVLQDALGSDYRIEQELDGGGMSRVFLATDLRHDRRVVVKVLSPELASDTSIARFKREIELTVRLQHPHILPILTSGAQRDTMYYVSPFIPGESLKARIERDGKLPLSDIVKFLRDVSGALAFAHQRGIVHRDVKPGNILLADGHAILADFGIARAVATNATPLTGSGMVPGTPAYMAPELPTDEKADVYALGVVAYEMLCGVLPKRGVTAKEIVAARGKVVGDSRETLRQLAELIEGATAPGADGRIVTARELYEHFDRVATQTTRTWSAAVFGVAAVVIASFVALGAWLRPRPLVPDRFAIVNASPDAFGAGDRVRQALAEWRGLTFADVTLAGSDGRIAASDALAAGRRVHASTLVLLETSREGDSIVVTATVRDVAPDTIIRVRRIAYTPVTPSGDRSMLFRRLANGILRSGEELPWQNASDATTPSLAAWRSYDAGRRALEAWRLADAESAFVRATTSDARVAPAHLWLAQTIQWSSPRDRWSDIKASAIQALDLHGLLRTADSLHAAGLVAIAAAEFPAACAAFDSMRRIDSTNVVAWMGLGDCRAMDHLVVRNARSASGWVFRGSFESAARAYQRAADLAPAGSAGDFQGFVLGRLSSVLFPVTNMLRLGTTPDDSISYAALPYANADTLAFAPVPTAELSNSPVKLDPAVVQAAVRRNRALMRQAAEDWVRRSPQSPAAYDSLATWVEVSGGEAVIGTQRLTTMDVVRRALTLSGDSTQRIHLGISRVRLMVKDGDFSGARANADSLLRAGAGRNPRYVVGLAGLAVLLGHVREAMEFEVRDPENARVSGTTGIITLPAQLRAARARFDIASAFALPGDSIAVLAQRISSVVDSYYPAKAEAGVVRAELLAAPLTLAYPVGRQVLAAIGEPRSNVFSMVSALARGDSTRARALLAEAQGTGVGYAPGLSVDMNFRRAVVAVALADTAAALRELDPVLHALPTLAPTLLRHISQIAGLVRALAVRAEIAEARHDRVTASQCASAVVALWGGADEELQPLVRRMKSLVH
jgi:eukaryotic-like serine/threonine-protein kinase